MTDHKISYGRVAIVLVLFMLGEAIETTGKRIASAIEMARSCGNADR